MKRNFLAASVALSVLVLAGCEKEPELETPAQHFSYGVGMNIGTSMREDGLTDIDVQALALGLQDALSNEPARLGEEELAIAFEEHQKNVQERASQLAGEILAANEAYLEENGKREGVTTTESGLQYEVLSKAEGDGPSPTESDVVTVHYEGKLLDGTVFDSSISRNEPIEFPVGGVIPGWVEVLQLMQVGDKWKVTIPSDLAYGVRSPSPLIPPNSVLEFEIELLEIANLGE
ncbi:MAG: peptidylprolyl isomerase [Gammaproteobacteria bacterium HGW-Gammaproteobacteria-11]|nr:MAG: peptidylprolyl isomerase [Gammaproteobacteria bacterium HGW-Gammaproteobacteria-11]